MNMRNMRGILVALILGGVGLVVTAAPKIVWLSTQLQPLPEAEWVRTQLLPAFTAETGISVEFIGSEYAPFADRVLAEYKAGVGFVALLGGLYGDYAPLMEAIADVGWVLQDIQALQDRTFIPAFLELAVEKGVQFTIPWMQATYLLVVNKKALKYLPEGANVWSLSYDDLLAWGKNIYEATGERMIGIPAGPGGLLHRLIHGYLYPSFTGCQIVKFDSPEAVKMWEYVKELWNYINPASTLWSWMDEPLLAEEVWVAWDHTVRVARAFKERPDDFIAVPAPAGPKGRGIITVLAGLSIPKVSPDPEAAAKLIEYLTRPATQVKVLEGVGWFPVVKEAAEAVPPGPLGILAAGVTAQAAAPDVIVSFIPPGLGVRAGEAWGVFRDTFVQIVIEGRPIKEVLLKYGQILREIYLDTMAPYGPPGC